MNAALIRKYNVPGPRYTSYPTVPFWDPNSFSIENWKRDLKESFDQSNEISLYIHLPFCEHLCVYCGCNTRITKNHKVEERYIEALFREWDLYLQVLEAKPVLKELHIGGGTPTFFSPSNLDKLLKRIIGTCIIPGEKEFSFEGHPNNTTEAHLRILHEKGFRRVSFGIQDFDPNVQKLIKRIQPYENVCKAVEHARAIGYQGINFDLIYGLPGQTLTTIKNTLSKTTLLSPDRIAFYSYAHIPHMKPAQRSFEQFLPTDEEKRSLYELGKDQLMDSGYEDIGMDHFAKKTDGLYLAQKEKKLHRNFMGYSLHPTSTLIGLGVSAISDSWTAFSQNEKVVEKYYSLLEKGELPVVKGHRLNHLDILLRKKILDIICHFETSWSPHEWLQFKEEINWDLIRQLEEDGLIKMSLSGMKVTPEGYPFIRNICMAFDARLLSKSNQDTVFSKTL